MAQIYTMLRREQRPQSLIYGLRPVKYSWAQRNRCQPKPLLSLMAFNFEILLESSQSKIGVVDTGVEPRKSITFVWLCKAKDNGFRRWMTIRKIPLTVSRKGPSTPPLTAALQPQSTRGPVSYCATPSQSRTLSLLSSQYLQPKQIYVNANPINLFIYRKTSSQTGILRFAISCT